MASIKKLYAQPWHPRTIPPYLHGCKQRRRPGHERGGPIHRIRPGQQLGHHAQHGCLHSLTLRERRGRGSDEGGRGRNIEIAILIIISLSAALLTSSSTSHITQLPHASSSIPIIIHLLIAQVALASSSIVLTLHPLPIYECQVPSSSLFNIKRPRTWHRSTLCSTSHSSTTSGPSPITRFDDLTCEGGAG